MNTPLLSNVVDHVSVPRAHVVDVVRGGSLKGEPTTCPRHQHHPAYVGWSGKADHVNPYRTAPCSFLKSHFETLVQWTVAKDCESDSHSTQIATVKEFALTPPNAVGNPWRPKQQ